MTDKTEKMKTFRSSVKKAITVKNKFEKKNNRFKQILKPV